MVIFMKIFVCIDKSNGMTFCGKRLSRDSVVCQKILEIVGQDKLHLNEYSAKLFENADRLAISDDFLCDGFCFIENVTVPSGADEYYIFNWNRDYPADTFFELDLKSEGYKKITTENLVGTSHKKITLEVYKKV